MKKYLFSMIGLCVLLYSSCRLPDTDEVEVAYPSEADFQNKDTVAFYFNDLLWVTLGSQPGMFAAQENEPNFFYRYDTTKQEHRLSVSSRMTLREDGQATFDQRFNLNVRYQGTLPGTIPLDSQGVRTFVISDQHQDRLYLSADSNPIQLEIITLDTLNRRIEGFFEGKLERVDTIGEPVEITQGRFGFTY